MSAEKGKLLPFRRAATGGDEITDEALIAACAVHDRAALGALYDRLSVPLYRFLSRMLGAGRPDLDDLVQATFLEIPRAAPRFRGGSSVQTWVFGIAANLARHHLRSETRRGNMLGAVARESSGTAPGARPDDAAARQQLLARLGGALDKLSHDHRTVFVLCDLEDIPGVEVARALGLREGTVWRRLHDARKRLRAALEGGE